MLWTSFSLVSKEKDALLQCLAIYFLPRTLPLCVDTFRAGKVYQTAVHTWWELTLHQRSRLDLHCLWCSSQQGCCYLPPVLHWGALPSDKRQVTGRDGSLSFIVLLYIQKIPSVWCGGVGFSLGPSPNVWAAFWEIHWARLVQIPISYFRESG